MRLVIRVFWIWESFVEGAEFFPVCELAGLVLAICGSYGLATKNVHFFKAGREYCLPEIILVDFDMIFNIFILI